MAAAHLRRARPELVLLGCDLLPFPPLPSGHRTVLRVTRRLLRPSPVRLLGNPHGYRALPPQAAQQHPPCLGRPRSLRPALGACHQRARLRPLRAVSRLYRYAARRCASSVLFARLRPSKLRRSFRSARPLQKEPTLMERPFSPSLPPRVSVRRLDVAAL